MKLMIFDDGQNFYHHSWFTNASLELFEVIAVEAMGNDELYQALDKEGFIDISGVYMLDPQFPRERKKILREILKNLHKAKSLQKPLSQVYAACA